ncbi:MAG: TIGR02757 family protein [Chlorobiota bacterium]|nr:MAG: TIGR02757 family protein [Chlorobiota bacterium]
MNNISESSSLKERLEHHYRAFGREKLSPDPLEIPHRFTRPEDITLAAFFAAFFAYGSVFQIIKNVNELLTRLEDAPYHTIKTAEDLEERVEGFYYRFYSTFDVATLLLALQKLLREHDGLKGLFMEGFTPERDLAAGIQHFSGWFLKFAGSEGRLTRGFRHFFPEPERGSACKRMNLFLRWMVREDDLDFGFWSEVGKENLIIPLDLHIARISKQLGLTARNDSSWRTASEITAKLREFDPEDPVKYDFALCHISMRKLEF